MGMAGQHGGVDGAGGCAADDRERVIAVGQGLTDGLEHAYLVSASGATAR